MFRISDFEFRAKNYLFQNLAPHVPVHDLGRDLPADQNRFRAQDLDVDIFRGHIVNEFSADNLLRQDHNYSFVNTTGLHK